MSQPEDVPLSPSQLPFNIHTTYYQSFFLLSVDIRLRGESIQIEGINSEDLFFQIPSSRDKLESQVLKDAVTAVANRCGVYNVARVHYGYCTLFEVDFTKARKIEQLLGMIKSYDFQSQLEKSIPLLANAADAQLLSIHCHLYLATPLMDQKECRLIEVTLDNYSDCVATLKNDLVFDYRHTCNSQVPKSGLELQVVMRELSGLGRWFSLGIYLGIPHHVVDGFHAYLMQGKDRPLIEVVQYWISSNKASWPSLVIALRQIGMFVLGKQIAIKYGCSELLSEALAEAPIESIIIEENEQRMFNAHEKVEQIRSDDDKIKAVLNEIKTSLEDITERTAKHMSQKEELLEKRQKYLKRKKIFAQFCKRSKSEATELVQEIEIMIDELDRQIDTLEMKIKDLTLDKKQKELEVKQYNISLQEHKETIAKYVEEIRHLQALLQSQRQTFDENVKSNKGQIPIVRDRLCSLCKDLDYKKVYKEFAEQKLKEDIHTIPEMHLGLSNNADDLLKLLVEEGAYLIRPSTSDIGAFTISALHCHNEPGGEKKKTLFHHKINYDAATDKYYLHANSECRFGSLAELAANLCNYCLQSTTGLSVKLTKPVNFANSQALVAPRRVPSPWQQFTDSRTQEVFYFNPVTRDMTHIKPT